MKVASVVAALLLVIRYASAFRGIPFVTSTTAAAAATREGKKTSEKEEEESLKRDGENFDHFPPTDKIQEEDVASDHVASNNHHSDPLLEVPCALSLADDNRRGSSTTSSSTKPMAVLTVCDSGAARTVLSYQAAQKAGLLRNVDQRYSGSATSVVGSCAILGRLPAGSVILHFDGVTVPAPAITVLAPHSQGAGGPQRKHPDLLLGLDFLRDHQAVLDLREESLMISLRNEDHEIPFARQRTRTDLSFSGGASKVAGEWDDEEEEEDYWSDDEEEYWSDEEEAEESILDMSGV